MIPRDMALARLTVGILSGMSSAGMIFLLVANWSTARVYDVIGAVVITLILAAYSCFILRHVPKT